MCVYIYTVYNFYLKDYDADYHKIKYKYFYFMLKLINN